MDPEGLNTAKAYFDVAPNKPDVDHLDAVTVREMVQSGQLSPYTEKAIDEKIGQEQPGVVSFGEIAPFLRGGEQGVLSESETELVRQSIEHSLVVKEEVVEEVEVEQVEVVEEIEVEQVKVVEEIEAEAEAEVEAEQVKAEEVEQEPTPVETPRPVFDAPLTDRPMDLGEHSVQPKAPVMMSRAARDLEDENHDNVLHDVWSKVPEEEALNQLRTAFNRHANNDSDGSDGSDVKRVPWSKLDDLVRDFGQSVSPAYVTPDNVLVAVNTLPVQSPSAEKERLDFEDCVNVVTKLPSNNLNNAKAFFEQVPNKPDADHLSRQQVQDVIDLGYLQPLSVEIIEKRVDRKQDGRVTFGELVPLVRMGPDCELADDEATTLRNELLAEPGPSIHKRFDDIPSKTKVLSGLRASFNKRAQAPTSEEIVARGVDPESLAGQRAAVAQSTVAWEDLAPIAREVLTDAGLSPVEVEKAVRQLPQEAPSDEQKWVDFERW